MTQLQDMIGSIGDALSNAQDLVNDATDDLYEAGKYAKWLLETLQCAETVETVADFRVNLLQSLEACKAVDAALLQHARDQDGTADERGELKSTLLIVRRELAEVKAEYFGEER